MVDLHGPGARPERGGLLPRAQGDDPVRGGVVALEDRFELPDPGVADRVVIEPGDAFEGVAEGEVADVVQQRRRARLVVLGGEVRDKGEHAEGVLQPGVGLRGRDRGGAGVGDEGEASHPPGPQQVALERSSAAEWRAERSTGLSPQPAIA